MYLYGQCCTKGKKSSLSSMPDYPAVSQVAFITDKEYASDCLDWGSTIGVDTLRQ